MGTTYHVKIVVNGSFDRKRLAAEIAERVETVNRLMSNWVVDSDVSRFNRRQETSPIEIDPHTAKVIGNALEIAKRTGGVLDPTLSPLIDLWGFGSQGPKEFPDNDVIAETLKHVGYRKLTLKSNTLAKSDPLLTLNLSANAKGYAVDLVAEHLLERGFGRFLVEIGGEIRVSGHNLMGEPWRLAIEKPSDGGSTTVYTVIHISDRAMATSGDYQKFFFHEGIRYSHILDPRSGKPVPSLVASVSVLTRDCMTADALATALMVLSPRQAIELVELMEDVECLLLIREGDTFIDLQSSGMAAYR